MITDKQEGEPVRLLQFENERSEADEVARLIELLKEEEGRRWDNFAIIYRVNSLSRQFETALTRRQIPYQVTAGVAFYERAEVKDLLAYLRVIENPADESAFSRIVNKPLRGLGKTSQDRLLAYSRQHRLTPLDAAATAQDVPKLSKRAIAGFQMFSKMIQEFSLADAGSVAELLKSVIDRTAYASPWTGGQSEESLSKLANVDELVNAARQYDEQAGEERSLQGFLEQTALVSDTDALEEDSGRVSLLTLHAAKGLEFPVVFIVGVEENLIPHQRSLRSEDGREVEEERRLLFVGMTRAQERLYLTCTQVRSMHGKTMPTISSMFLRELEYEFVDLGLPFLSDSSSWNERMDVDEDLNIVFEDADATSSIKTSPKLMTGASLLNGEGGSIELPRGYSIGDQVRHPRYGRGTVIDVGGFGMRRTVTVVFGDDRKETFVASKAPLQPVG